MRTPIVLSKHGFRIGDRVRFVDEIDPDDGVVFDQEGTICTFEGCDDDNIGVRWDKNSEDYHNCANFCEQRHGWYVPYHSLVSIGESIDLGEIAVETNSIDALFGTIL